MEKETKLSKDVRNYLRAFYPEIKPYLTRRKNRSRYFIVKCRRQPRPDDRFRMFDDEITVTYIDNFNRPYTHRKAHICMCRYSASVDFYIQKGDHWVPDYIIEGVGHKYNQSENESYECTLSHLTCFTNGRATFAFVPFVLSLLVRN